LRAPFWTGKGEERGVLLREPEGGKGGGEIHPDQGEPGKKILLFPIERDSSFSGKGGRGKDKDFFAVFRGKGGKKKNGLRVPRSEGEKKRTLL